MTLSEMIDRHVELKMLMRSEDYYEKSIAYRRGIDEEMTDLKKDIDHFENMVYDMYSMLNRHEAHIYQTGNE